MLLRKLMATRSGRSGTRLASALVACSAVTGCQVAIEPEFCGGIAGVTCASGQFCKYDDGTCGRADQSGVCELVPDLCIEIFQPVCGCDDQTYSNDCFASVAGVSVDSEGTCEDR